MTPLKLIALDPEDLRIVSAHLQDALARVADMAWLAREKRFVMLVNRFAWETALGGEAAQGAEMQFERRAAALHFERVLSVRRRKVRQDTPEAVLNLLTIHFSETEPPAGTVDLLFSLDAAIRLEVECIEARLADLGPAWQTEARPEHAVDGEAPPEGQ